MKFNKLYKQYMESFVSEGLLGSIASAIPRTIASTVGNVVKQAYADNPYVQAYGQVRQAQKGEREAQRTKEDAVLEKVKKELMDDPSFINKKISFQDPSKSLNVTASYNELTNYRLTVINRASQEEIKELIQEKDLNNPNIYDDTAKKLIIDKIQKVVDQMNKESKQDKGEDYNKVKTDVKQVLLKLDRMLKDLFKPISNENIGKKIIWMYIITAITGENLTINR